ncbi:phytanoyl-CoA dioxygenase family protein [Fulvivirga lutimaris]|uniref:phytanoyl-CoA dioxygenase family protein n=1 Tax=Fulvivirga lutimaris TaxID=1819566 RepID=UPI0012BD819A|nr:phytanoyl-CoA dioxygenase family protein [Fulvivirga lutimaris]MTI37938.1 phytanoyl-CoA dioxygenase [Fulvivirga lutimaris]
MKCQLYIDNELFEYEVEGEFAYGNDEVLIKQDKNAIDHVDWSDVGHTTLDILNTTQFNALKDNLVVILNRIMAKYDIPDIDILEDYHKVANTQERHLQVINETRSLTRKDFDVDLNAVCELISQHLGKAVAIENPKLDTEVITLRISRPNSFDINPLHRDAYLDYYKDTINLWIPIAGCNKKSSLPIIPKSHLWNEADVLRTAAKGATLKGLKYHVPGIVKGPDNELHAIRPNPKYGESIIFSPYLIHGSAVNLNEDITRMALELRPCLK